MMLRLDSKEGVAPQIEIERLSRKEMIKAYIDQTRTTAYLIRQLFKVDPGHPFFEGMSKATHGDLLRMKLNGELN